MRPTRRRSSRRAQQARAGRAGGATGGRARAERMTPEQRSAAARKAAKARWGSGSERMSPGSSTRSGHRVTEESTWSLASRRHCGTSPSLQLGDGNALCPAVFGPRRRKSSRHLQTHRSGLDCPISCRSPTRRSLGHARCTIREALSGVRPNPALRSNHGHYQRPQLWVSAHRSRPLIPGLEILACIG